MEKIKGIDSSLLTEAVLVWTGWGNSMMPSRDDSQLIKKFGGKVAVQLIPVIKALEEDFYSSSAIFTSEDIEQMEMISSEEFRGKYPTLSDEIIKAFAWCYTFDFR